MAEPRVIRFLFDYISPYAYLAWAQVHDAAARAGARVEPTPILFAALLDHHGHLGPAEIPPKRLYVFKEVVRRAHALGLPLVPPPAHPFNPLPALRATLAAPPERRRAVIDAVFACVWGGASPHGVETPARAAEVATAAGAPMGEEALADPAVKRALFESTGAAIEAGVFGVPTFVVDGEVFWGADSLPHVEAFLAGDDPVDPALLARWRDLPVGKARAR